MHIDCWPIRAISQSESAGCNSAVTAARRRECAGHDVQFRPLSAQPTRVARPHSPTGDRRTARLVHHRFRAAHGNCGRVAWNSMRQHRQSAPLLRTAWSAVSACTCGHMAAWPANSWNDGSSGRGSASSPSFIAARRVGSIATSTPCCATASPICRPATATRILLYAKGVMGQRLSQVASTVPARFHRLRLSRASPHQTSTTRTRAPMTSSTIWPPAAACSAPRGSN